MTTTRDEQAERSRQLILTTAQRLFAGQGYDATSLQMIADTVGVTKAHVYYYFRTKAELLAEINAPIVARMHALFDEALTIRTKRQRTQYLVEGYVDVLIGNRRTSTLATNDPALRREREVSSANRAVRERGFHILFGVDPTPAQAVAYMLIEALSQAVPMLPALDDDELRVVLIDACERLLRSNT